MEESGLPFFVSFFGRSALRLGVGLILERRWGCGFVVLSESESVGRCRFVPSRGWVLVSGSVISSSGSGVCTGRSSVIVGVSWGGFSILSGSNSSSGSTYSSVWSLGWWKLLSVCGISSAMFRFLECSHRTGVLFLRRFCRLFRGICVGSDPGHDSESRRIVADYESPYTIHRQCEGSME